MRRVLLIGVMLVVLVGAVIAPVAAAPVDELAGFARYFPDETVAYIGFRTDDAFLDEIQALMDRVTAALPPGQADQIDLREELDRSLRLTFGRTATYDNTIRSWLGDAAAFGVTSLGGMMGPMSGMGSSDTPVLLAIEITDATAARIFLRRTLKASGTTLTIDRVGDYTIFTPDFPSNAIYAVGEDALFVASERSLLPLNDDFLSLADNPKVRSALNLLPGDDYIGVMALNLGDVFLQSFDMMMMMSEEMGPSADLIEDLQPIYENYPAQALGFTVADERALTLDLAQSAFDYSALSDTWFGGFQPPIPSPVDLAFAEHVPADAPFYLQGSNLGAVLDIGLNAIGFAVELGAQTSMANGMGSSDMPPFLEDISASDVRTFIDLAFAGMTGLNLEDDVLAHLDGNYALYGRVVPSEQLGAMLDAALLLEVTDQAAMQNIYDQLTRALTRYEADFTEEDSAIVFPGALSDLLSGGIPSRMLDEDVFDLMLGLSDTAFAVGTRGAVEYSLNPTGDSMADDPDFQAASGYFLPGAQSIGYIGFRPIQDLIEMLYGNMPATSHTGAQMGMANHVLGMFDSLSLSGVVNDDYSSVSRVVLTLSE